MLSRLLRNGLEGRGAHVNTVSALAGLEWAAAGERPESSPYSVWQLLNHMIYWQDFLLARLRGAAPPVPEQAVESWPGGERPNSSDEWAAALSQFQAGLAEALQAAGQDSSAGQDLIAGLATRPEHSRAEAIAQIIGHNSYHLGQIVLLRRMLGAWPPPGGGDTW